jgi:hypothetical protein
MTSSSLRLTAARTVTIIALLYLYSPDVQALLLGRFNKPDTFGTFLVIEALHGILMCLLVWCINRISFESGAPLRLAAWLMFINGCLFNFAYAMGPPPRGTAVLAAHDRENVRFMFLVAAATLATAGLLVFLLRKATSKRSPARLCLALLMLAGYALFLYVEVAYYVIRPRLISHLLLRGSPLDNHVGQASMPVEAAGRLCFYWGVPMVLYIGLREKSISRSAALVIGFLSTMAGFGLLHAALYKPDASLMPFTIPAWVLMPTYWLGLHILTRASIRSEFATRDNCPPP